MFESARRKNFDVAIKQHCQMAFCINRKTVAAAPIRLR
jgi:hypothetical protein